MAPTSIARVAACGLSLSLAVAEKQPSSAALVQTWERSATGKTPVQRVVGLLKEMQGTLDKEMEEDEALYDKLACWCNNNQYGKSNAASESQAKIADLQSSIESLTARKSELGTQIKELEAEVVADKQALSEASALREKQQKEFHNMELDSTQAIENVKAALTVLSKHHDGAFPQLSQSQYSALQLGKDMPWTEEHESHTDRSLDDFMQNNGFETNSDALVGPKNIKQHFLQAEGMHSVSASSSAWDADEVAVVRNALRHASALVQARHGQNYMPSYNAQSGEIVGVMKQLQEEMMGDLSAEQKTEISRAALFAQLRDAKSTEIAEGEKMAEKKEDELATASNDLAEAKEDLGQETDSLSETQKFLANLSETCAEADKNFAARKQARTAEIQAVSETINILTADEARDTLSSTYSLVQVAKVASRQDKQIRRKAAAALRKVATATHDPKMSVLATSVELDAFAEVKKAIDDMVGMLKVEQADEVKKNDWCNSQLQETEMSTAKTTDGRADLAAQEAALESNIQTLTDAIASAHGQVADLQLNLQRASEDRKAENMEFQKTVAEQAATVEILKKALDKLAKFYDDAALLQRQSQTPPVAQMEYKPSSGSGGVMQMIEKLVSEAKEMTADAKKSESEAQTAYEQAVANTNGSVEALQNEIVSKTKAKGQASKDKLQASSDITDTDKELEGLAATNADLHGECDYVMKNFEVRQDARAQEMEALQQAKQILSGASA